MTRLNECLCKFSRINYHCIIAGDFNCAGIDWQSLIAPADGTQDKLFDFVIKHGFSQIVLREKITYSKPLSMFNVNVLQPFNRSDHCQVEFSVFSDCVDACVEPALPVKRLDWSRADYGGMSNYINAVNWYDMLATNLIADSLWAAFSDVLQTAVDIFVPVKQVTEHTIINNKRWYVM